MNIVTLKWIVDLAVDLPYLDVPLVVDDDPWRSGCVGQAPGRSIGSAHHREQADRILAQSCIDRQVDYKKSGFNTLSRIKIEHRWLF